VFASAIHLALALLNAGLELSHGKTTLLLGDACARTASTDAPY
jgi:hypothetical protein